MTTLDLTLQNLSKTLLTMQEQVAQHFARQRRAMQEQAGNDDTGKVVERALQRIGGE